MTETRDATWGVIPGSWKCDTCGFVRVTVAINPDTGASGPNRVHDADDLRCPNDGAQMRSETWRERALDAEAFNAKLGLQLHALRAEITDAEGFFILGSISDKSLQSVSSKRMQRAKDAVHHLISRRMTAV